MKPHLSLALCEGKKRRPYMAQMMSPYLSHMMSPEASTRSRASSGRTNSSA